MSAGRKDKPLVTENHGVAECYPSVKCSPFLNFSHPAVSQVYRFLPAWKEFFPTSLLSLPFQS